MRLIYDMHKFCRLSPLLALGAIANPTFGVAQEKESDQPKVIILEVVSEKQEAKRTKEAGQEKGEGVKRDAAPKKKQPQVLEKAKKAKRKSRKKPPVKQQEFRIEQVRPDSRHDHDAKESRHPHPSQEHHPDRVQPHHPPHEHPHPGPGDREQGPPRIMEFRWEAHEGDRGAHPPGSPRHDGPPPHREVEELHRELERQRGEMQNRIRELEHQVERARGEVEERSRRAESSTEAMRHMEQKTRELAEQLEKTQHHLEERTREVHKLQRALAEREEAIGQIKKELAVRMNAESKKPDESDRALLERIERIEVELRKVMSALKQSAVKSAPKFSPKVVAPPEVKAKSKAEGQFQPEIQLELRPKVRAIKEKQTLQSPKKRNPDVQPAVVAVEAPPAPPAPLEEPSAATEPASETPPLPPMPTGTALGGVGVVEGDVTALLTEEGKILLKVTQWNDGKRLRPDWIGQRVAIVHDGMPQVKVGDHIAIDARIDGQRGFVWGGKVFQGAPVATAGR